MASWLTAPARVAAKVVIRVSRLTTWLSSWASTPSSSRRSINRKMPSVTATAACCGLRPVAKAFGVSVGMRYSGGAGIPARLASFSTISYSQGASARASGRAPLERSASLSLNQ